MGWLAGEGATAAHRARRPCSGQPAPCSPPGGGSPVPRSPGSAQRPPPATEPRKPGREGVCVWGGGEGGRDHLSAAPTAASRAGPLLGHAPLPRPHSPALPTAGWRPPPQGRAEGPAGGGAGPPAAGSPKGGKSPAAAPRRPLSAAPPPASASCARPGLVPPRSAAL